MNPEISKSGMFQREKGLVSMQPRETYVAQVAQAVSTSAAIVDLNKGDGPIQLWPVYSTTTVSVKNKDTTNAKDVVAYIFNNSALKETVNEAAYVAPAVPADYVEVKYNDGVFAGKLIERTIEQMNGGLGLKCKGVQIMARDENGNPSNEAITLMDARLVTYETINGTETGQNIDFSEAIKNNAFKDGLIDISLDFFVNALTQFKFNCPKGYEYVLKFRWV